MFPENLDFHFSRVIVHLGISTKFDVYVSKSLDEIFEYNYYLIPLSVYS